MDPAPLCKTAILSFIIDKTFSKFWNVSSDSRKRAQMIVGDRHIIIREYNESALKINGWVKVGKQSQSVKTIEEIKKGVSNYWLDTQEQIERVISLNGKLRCYSLYFNPEVPFEIDYIQKLEVDSSNYDFYSKYSFNKVFWLNFINLSFMQIKEIINNFKQIEFLEIYGSSLSKLDLSLANIHSLMFEEVTFRENFYLPLNLKLLELTCSQNIHFLNCKRVTKIVFSKDQLEPSDSFAWIKNYRKLKTAQIGAPLSKFINHLPNTTREIGQNIKIDSENIDLSNIKEKLPLLLIINSKAPIEIAQKLNLRIIDPIINETQEKFSIRPMKIFVRDYNVQQLNKHPELFGKVRKIRIWCNGFNFDCLPDKVKEIEFYMFSIAEDKFESLQENNWKFEETEIHICAGSEDQIRIILNCFKKVKRIRMFKKYKHLSKYYPHLNFDIR